MNSKKMVFWILLLVVAGLLWAVQRQHVPATKMMYSQFVEQLDADKVKDAVISVSEAGANPVAYTLRDGTPAETMLPRNYGDLLSTMQQQMVNVEIRDASAEWKRLLGNASPFLLLLALWFFMLTRLRAAQGS